MEFQILMYSLPVDKWCIFTSTGILDVQCIHFKHLTTDDKLYLYPTYYLKSDTYTDYMYEEFEPM